MHEFGLDVSTPQHLDSERSALIVVDLQYGTASRNEGLGRRLIEEGRQENGNYRFSRVEDYVVPNTQRLTSAFRSVGALVCFLTVGSRAEFCRDIPQHRRRFAEYVGNRDGSREHEILDELGPAPGAVVLHKTTTGGFNSSGLDSLLRAKQIDTIVLTGVSTNSCVETTARGGADRHYQTIVVEDACGAASEDLHREAMERIGRLYGHTMTTSQVVGLIN